MDKESKLETTAGALPTTIGATLLAALSGTPTAALLPVLTSALASGRHKRRVESAIKNIETDLEAQKELLADLSDSQYKLVNEAILAIFQTIDEEKLRSLRNVISRSLILPVEEQESVLISRLVRDLSAAEVKFLNDYRNTSRFMLSETRPSDSQAVHILPDSELGLVASGLVALGLLVSAEPTWDDTGRLRFAPIVPKLVSLFDQGDA